MVFNFKHLLFILLISTYIFAGEKQDFEGDRLDGCTTITVGKNASFDGSVMTSHTCDSHRTRSWFDITPAKSHNPENMLTLVKRVYDDSLAMPTYKYIPTGDIPQVENTHGYINTAYPCMNEHQLAIGETTFGGRESLHSKKGLIDCQQLVRLMLERCTTARKAIQLAGSLTKQYGWNDAGETLTIADKNEVWHLDIVGPGKGNVGSIWVASNVLLPRIATGITPLPLLLMQLGSLPGLISMVTPRGLTWRTRLSQAKPPSLSVTQTVIV